MCSGWLTVCTTEADAQVNKRCERNLVEHWKVHIRVLGHWLTVHTTSEAVFITKSIYLSDTLILQVYVLIEEMDNFLADLTDISAGKNHCAAAAICLAIGDFVIKIK